MIRPKSSSNFPLVAKFLEASVQRNQIINLSWFYFRWIVRQIPFLATVSIGVFSLIILAFAVETGDYGVEPLATSGRITQLIGTLDIFLIIITIFYTGEIVWVERDSKINLMLDALPHRNFVSVSSKFIALCMTTIFILLILLIFGIVIQMIKGFPIIEWQIYMMSLFIDTFSLVTLYTVLSLFVQVMVNQKLLGIGITILLYLLFFSFNLLGIEHGMFHFGRAIMVQHSDMNGYGHSITPFLWFNTYWYGLAGVLFTLVILFWVRGLEFKFQTRIKLCRDRINTQIVLLIVGSATVFVGSGGYIFYNTNILNTYRNSNDQKTIASNYEHVLKKFEFLSQPKIVSTFLEVDIYPLEGSLKIKGHYVLKNKSDQNINNLHVQSSTDDQVKTNLSFHQNVAIKDQYDQFDYVIYNLSRSLTPGDTLQLDFEITLEPSGFKEQNLSFEVVRNGSFFTNLKYLPSLGYNERLELNSKSDREEFGLENRKQMMEQDDPIGIATNLVGDDADRIELEVILSTDSSQMAVAPGDLIRQWNEDGRSHYHYKMESPINNFYCMVSGEYEIMRERWKSSLDSPEVELNIFYHKGHDANTDQMMRGMKASLSYYSEHFSAYPYEQLHILEFPRYRKSAQSFPNTIPFSENLGFVQNIKSKNVNLPFYVTAHEVAHQWWGRQVREARVKGSAMISETLSQYSALMVMKKSFSPDIIKKFLRYELDGYLTGRSRARNKETPLQLVENQSYIHYCKGSLIMYALQDYIGEDSVNAALRRFLEDWKYKEGVYPTSKDLIGYYREVTADTLQYIISDMFERITLYDNKTIAAQYVDHLDGTYTIKLDVEAVKLQADGLGEEKSTPLRDYIDIGVYGFDEQGGSELIYLKKHLIDKKSNLFEIELNQKPIRAGIDPIHKLIDRNPDDNVKELKAIEI